MTKKMAYDNRGFGAVAMILAMVGILALAAVAATIQAKQDQQTAQTSSAQSNITQQAIFLRNAIRNCYGKMKESDLTSDMVVGMPSHTINRFPDCRIVNNSGQNAGVCVNDGTQIISDVGNLFCKATNNYVIDPQQSQFNPKPIEGFGNWQYVKKIGADSDSDGGITVRIVANDPALKQRIYDNIRGKFLDKELTADTANQNNGIIEIYAYRTRFAPGGDTNPPNNGSMSEEEN